VGERKWTEKTGFGIGRRGRCAAGGAYGGENEGSFDSLRSLRMNRGAIQAWWRFPIGEGPVSGGVRGPRRGEYNVVFEL
jgi:hypothetical protein